MKLTLLGTGTPVASLHRAGSSYLLELDDRRVLVDCGPFSSRRLLEAGIRPSQLDAILLTHLHYDHCADYSYLVLNRWDESSDELPDLEVAGPAHTRRMTDLLFAGDGVWGPDLENRATHPNRRKPAPVVREVGHGDRFETAGCRVRVAEVVHCQPALVCLAYRIEEEGRTIVFGGDSAPTPALTELARGADVLLHMCHFLNGPDANPRLMEICSGHLDAARTARDADVGKLVLVHLGGELDDPAVQKRALTEIREIWPGEIVFGADLTRVAVD